jgi:hypothetical protein
MRCLLRLPPRTDFLYGGGLNVELALALKLDEESSATIAEPADHSPTVLQMNRIFESRLTPLQRQIEFLGPLASCNSAREQP